MFIQLIFLFKNSLLSQQIILYLTNQQHFFQIQRMNIKISIKDCQCNPTVSNYKEISEVQHKKKTMLYAPPERDSHQTNARRNNKNTVKQSPSRRKNPLQSQQYKQSQRQMLEELKKNGKNHATLDMIQNSNTILQRQNEILQHNQKTLNDAIKNGKSGKSSQQQSARNQIKSALEQIKQQVGQIKKMRNQIIGTAQQFNRNINELKNGRGQANNALPRQMSQLNSNFKDLVQVSQNHLEGLQNLQAIKSLQNFNIQSYTQAINSIKRQIAQYQKQSENIQRQLKIRVAKLQKLDISPNFEQELYKPYQEHLNNRINNIDLHSIRDRVYDKLGTFDYGKFESDISHIMSQAKNQLGNFPLICKEYQINVPQIKIDMREIKNLDIKIPSVLQQYKAAHNIKFDEKKQNDKRSTNQQTSLNANQKMPKTKMLQQKLKQNSNLPKSTQNFKNIPSRPIDKSHGVRLTKPSDKPSTILQNDNKKKQKQIQQKFTKTNQQKKKQDEDFQRYLQNRAKQELQLIYKERKQKLERMQKNLEQTCKQPMTFIDLNLKKEDVKRKGQKKQNQIQKQEQEYYDQQFEEQQQKSPKKQEQGRYQTKEQEAIKQMGRQILKQKLKNLIGKKNNNTNIQKRQITQINVEKNHPGNEGERQIQNMAQGFINMINNTLTQVNANLVGAIERKISTSQQRRPASLERKQRNKIQVPKLQPFKAPPVLNMNVNLVQQRAPHYSYQVPPPQPVPVQKKKIVIEDYNNLKPKLDDESYSQLNISDMDDDI